MTDRGLLARTFVHIGGIGRKTEVGLWNSGVLSWDELRFTRVGDRAGVRAALEASEAAWSGGDLDYFFTALPAIDRWRTFVDFADDYVAVDIETTGMSVYDHVTMIGIEHGGDYQAFIRGANLDQAADVLAHAKGVISFNGALFDLPFIARTFPDLKLPAAHVDLRFLARRVGLAGSLKTVERIAEIRRAKSLEDISGVEAVLLWHDYIDGDAKAVTDLVRYNAADTCVLHPLAWLIADRLLADLDDDGVSANGQLRLDTATHPRPASLRRRRVAAVSTPTVARRQRDLRVGCRTIALPPARRAAPLVDLATLRERMRDPASRMVGIDLTGSEQRPTGWALLEGNLTVTGVLGATEEIIERTVACRPSVVSIDSPLSLPAGRDCTDDDCSCRPKGGITRHCERELKRRGVNVYPCLIRSMQALTSRGMLIAAELRTRGVTVIESYPGAAQDIMRIPRKRASLSRLRTGLERFGISGIRAIDAVTHDELDAITSAAVGAFYLADLYEALGTETEDYLIIPSIENINETGTAEQTAIAGPRRHVLVGACAGAVARRGRRGAVSIDAIGSGPDDALIVADSVEDYLHALSDLGPRLRSGYIAAPGERLRRRPSFVDWQLSADDPALRRRISRWVAEGAAT
jgi:uncharacterized protein YprB with RNaseH-like and TPR domain/predicted nuclease with RNAse H fold